MKYVLNYVNLLNGETINLDLEFISLTLLNDWVITEYPNMTSYQMVAVKL